MICQTNETIHFLKQISEYRRKAQNDTLKTIRMVKDGKVLISIGFMRFAQPKAAFEQPDLQL